MKQITILTLLLFSLLGCSQEKSVDDGTLVHLDIPQQDRILYAISLSLYHPFELYINDIKVYDEQRSGTLKVDINPWVLKNGKYEVKLKLFHQNIPEDILESTRVDFVSYIWFEDEEKRGNSRNIIKSLPVIYNQNSNYTEQTWEVEITDLPYELTGWSKSRDLRKMDSIQLKKQVVAYYQKLWNILNEGDYNSWEELTNKRSNETKVFSYTSSEKINKYKKINRIAVEERSKGNMLPIEDYTLQIDANGKLVSLVRNATKEFHGYDANIKGWGVLIRKYNGALRSMGVKLHMPPAKKSLLADEPEWGDFEIIRK